MLFQGAFMPERPNYHVSGNFIMMKMWLETFKRLRYWISNSKEYEFKFLGLPRHNYLPFQVNFLILIFLLQKINAKENLSLGLLQVHLVKAMTWKIMLTITNFTLFHLQYCQAKIVV